MQREPGASEDGSPRRTISRATARDPEEVLDAALAHRGRFRGRHRVGHVTGEGHVEFACLVGDREVRRPREQRVDLNEVGALVAHRVHGRSALGRGRDRMRARPHRVRPVDDAPGGHDTRSDPRFARDRVAHGTHLVQRPEHVAHPRNAVRDEQQREDRDRRPVHVHVPEAGDEKLPPSVHHPGTLGHWGRCGVPDEGDPVSADEYGSVRRGLCILPADDGDADDGQGMRDGGPGCTGAQSQQDKPHRCAWHNFEQLPGEAPRGVHWPCATRSERPPANGVVSRATA